MNLILRNYLHYNLYDQVRSRFMCIETKEGLRVRDERRAEDERQRKG